MAHPLSLVGALDYAAWHNLLRREAPVAQEHAESAIALAREHGFPQYEALGVNLWGAALAQQGQSEAGLNTLRQGIANALATGAESGLAYMLSLLAEADKQSPEAGLAALAKALTVVETTDERWWEAELYRLRGLLLLSQSPNNQSEAESCFHKALEVSRHQEAKSLELRAATSLARLWQSQGKRQDAYDLLAPVYEWFTEVFDTADLVDAKVLLDELGTEKIPSIS